MGYSVENQIFQENNMSLFGTKLNLTVKFFYPWETIADEGCRYMSLAEEVIELIWNSGDYQRKIETVLKRFSVKDWDWEDDGDDYIEVTFNDNIDSDALHSEIDQINSQFGYIWDVLVREGRANIEVYKKDEEPDEVEEVEEPDNVWTTKPLRNSGVIKPSDICPDCGCRESDCICEIYEPDEPANIWTIKQTTNPVARAQNLGRQKRMGMFDTPEPESEEVMDNNDIDPYEREEPWDTNIPEVSGNWDTAAPEPKKKDEWSVWNK